MLVGRMRQLNSVFHQRVTAGGSRGSFRKRLTGLEIFTRLTYRPLSQLSVFQWVRNTPSGKPCAPSFIGGGEK